MAEMAGSSAGLTPTLDVAVCQLTSIDDLLANQKQIFSVLKSLEAVPPALICFPENSLYLRVKEGEAMLPLSVSDPVFESFRNWCRTFKSNIHLGSVPLHDGAKLYNASLLFRADGSMGETYRKIHLFDVDVAGHKPVRESDVFAAGDAPSIFSINGWRIGSSICYDLRFSELYHQYAVAEVDTIVIPSAFLVPTGEAHWEILTRARAIESQAYVLAAAQGGEHVGLRGGTRKTFGHSMIIGPWGEVVATLPDDFGSQRVLRATLSRERLSHVRGQIPMKSHRRL